MCSYENGDRTLENRYHVWSAAISPSQMELGFNIAMRSKKMFRDVVSDPKVTDFRSVHPVQLGELPMIVTVDLVIKCRKKIGATQHHSQSPDWLLRLPQELGGRAPEVKKLRSGPKR